MTIDKLKTIIEGMEIEFKESKDCLARKIISCVFSKVSATTIPQYINSINNRPIGRIEYALV